MSVKIVTGPSSPSSIYEYLLYAIVQPSKYKELHGEKSCIQKPENVIEFELKRISDLASVVCPLSFLVSFLGRFIADS